MPLGLQTIIFLTVCDIVLPLYISYSSGTKCQSKQVAGCDSYASWFVYLLVSVIFHPLVLCKLQSACIHVKKGPLCLCSYCHVVNSAFVEVKFISMRIKGIRWNYLLKCLDSVFTPSYKWGKKYSFKKLNSRWLALIKGLITIVMIFSHLQTS